MRLIVFVSILCCLCFHTVAQDSLKASSRDWTTELNVNPFQGSISLNNAVNQIKVRRFISDELALRIAFVTNFIKETGDVSNVYGNNPIDMSEEKKKSLLGLNFGIERHFKGTKRLSPYFGGEFLIHNKGAKHEVNDINYDFTIENAWLTYQYDPQTGYGNYAFAEQASVMVGISAIAGFDFYIAKNFYFGYEFTYGILRTKYKKVAVESTGDSIVPEDYPDIDNKSFSFGASLVNGIRLGFVF